MHSYASTPSNSGRVRQIAISHSISPCSARRSGKSTKTSSPSNTLTEPAPSSQMPPSALPKNAKIAPELLHRIEVATPSRMVGAHSPMTQAGAPLTETSNVRMSDELRSRVQRTPTNSTFPKATSPAASTNIATTTLSSRVRLSPELLERVEHISQPVVTSPVESNQVDDAEIGRVDEVPTRLSQFRNIRFGPGVLERVETVPDAGAQIMRPSIKATSSLMPRTSSKVPKEAADLTPEDSHLVTRAFIESLKLKADVRRRIQSIN